MRQPNRRQQYETTLDRINRQTSFVHQKTGQTLFTLSRPERRAKARVEIRHSRLAAKEVQHAG